MNATVEKTEEQIAKEKAAVEALKSAKANMTAALSRIETLERAVGYALDCMTKNKRFVASDVYVHFYSGPQKTVHAEIDEQIAHIRKSIG